MWNRPRMTPLVRSRLPVGMPGRPRIVRGPMAECPVITPDFPTENSYSEELVRLWACITMLPTKLPNSPVMDLALSAGIEEMADNEPSWWRCEVEEQGIWEMVREAYPPVSTHPEDNTFDDDERKVRWLLGHGLAPGQWFEVLVYQPEYSVDYYGEGDVSYSAELGRREEITVEQAAHAWSEWARAERAAVTQWERDSAWLTQLQLTDLDALYMTFQQDDSAYYDTYARQEERVKWWTVSISSTHQRTRHAWANRWVVTARGLSEEDAATQVIRAFRKLNPQATVEQLRRIYGGPDWNLAVDAADRLGADAPTGPLAYKTTSDKWLGGWR